MISLDNISLQFGERPIFSNVSILINPKDKIGIVGKNGSGKSTLLKLIYQEIKPESGEIVIPQDIRIGYLPQHMEGVHKATLIEEVSKAFTEINKLETEIKKISDEISSREDYNSPDYNRLVQKLTEKNEYYHMLEGHNREAEIEQVLKGLGFGREEFNLPVSELSGGWRMRIELAKILLKTPHIFLLDEPTNHLDIESIQWLEYFLINYRGAVLLISHDKLFLDRISNRTIEISLGKIYDYKVSYSKFLLERQERRISQINAYKNQQKLIENTRKFIERFRYKATKAVQVQSRIKMLENLEIIEVDKEDSSAIHIAFPLAERAGDIVIEINKVSKIYGDKLVLKAIDLIVERGEKIAFVGRNGEGKTTLAKIINQEIKYEGSCRIGYNVILGYFAQDQEEQLLGDKTVLETIDEVAKGDIRTKIRDILGAFLFSGEDIDKKVKVLSGGEKSRLALIKLLLESYNLLLLDEPTNHLDIHSKDLLKKALLAFKGTCIIVSHDREFLDGLVDKVYEFRNHKIKEYRGGIQVFLEKKMISSFRDLNCNVSLSSTQVDEQNNKTISDNKSDYLKRKEYEKLLRKLSNKLNKLETNIDTLENKLQHMEAKLSDPTQLTKEEAAHLYQEYNRLETELARQMQLWENLSLEYEEQQNQRK